MTGFTKQKPSELQVQRLREVALKGLQFDKKAEPSMADVKERFRMLVKQGHPDVACVGHAAQHNYGMQSLRECKDILIKMLEHEDG